MEIFKELKKLGYIHYSATTIEELDALPLNSTVRTMEQALVLRWFRENYNLRYKFEPSREKTVDIFIWNIVGWEYFKNTKEEEAELACLIKLIEIVKEKSNEQD